VCPAPNRLLRDPRRPQGVDVVAQARRYKKVIGYSSRGRRVLGALDESSRETPRGATALYFFWASSFFTELASRSRNAFPQAQAPACRPPQSARRSPRKEGVSQRDLPSATTGDSAWLDKMARPNY